LGGVPSQAAIEQIKHSAPKHEPATEKDTSFCISNPGQDAHPELRKGQEVRPHAQADQQRFE
jgi:hypothetical protein